MNKHLPNVVRALRLKGRALAMVVFLFALVMAPLGANAQYCGLNGPVYGYCCSGNQAMGVNGFAMGSINNTVTPRNGGSTPGPVDDYTDQSTVVVPGQSYNFTVTTNDQYEQFIKIWIDWNEDGVFDDYGDELAFSEPISNINSHSGQINVPGWVSPSCTKRMRVYSDYAWEWYNQGREPDPCGDIYYGTAHDYTISVAGGSGVDIGMAKKNTPISWIVGSNAFNVKIKNYAGSNINSAQIGYRINENTPVTQNVSFGTPLGGCASVDLSYTTNVNIPAAGFYRLRFWVRNPNNTYPDNNTLNDTIDINICTGLSGSYTINAAGAGASNFLTFNDAVAAMVNCGVGGPVVFNVAAGTYNEQITIPAILGASATNTITFTGGANGAGSRLLQFNGVSIGAHHTVRLDGAKHIIFNNLTIRGVGTNMGWPVHIKSATSNIKVKNCIISTADANTANGNTNHIPVVFSSDNNYYYYQVSNINNIEIDSNVISGGYFGVSMYGGSTSDIFELKFRRNTLDKWYYYGFYMQTYNNAHVNYNIIEQRATTQVNGIAIHFYNAQGSDGYTNEIIGNEIKKFGNQAIYVYSAQNNSGTGLINNNIIYGQLASTNAQGIYFGYSNNWNAWHNSVNMAQSTTDNGSYALYTVGTGGIDIKSNILSVTGVASSAKPLYLNSSGNVSGLDFNNYYKKGGNESSPLMNINGTDYSQKTWNTSGFNTKSVSKEPLFTSNTNLRLSAIAISPFGDPALGLATDIDGKARCAQFPSMGASESPYVVILDPQIIADDTLFVDSPADILNNSLEGEPKIHLWNIGNLAIFSSVNVKYTFTNVGVYTLKLRTTTCSGVDSASKNVRVINPRVPPMSAFISDINEADQGSPVQLTDLSTGGASSWMWTATPSAGVQFTPGPNAQNPIVTFANVGQYNICLRATNSAGPGNLNCKTAYVKVVETNIMCGTKAKSKTASGKLFDDGGKNGSYGNNKNCSFLLDPCASEVTLSFTNFSMEAGDVLRIYDGADATGKALHTGTGFSGSIIPGDVTASTGKMFIQMVTNSSGNNAGFEAKWTSVAKSFNKPVAAFRAPDTLYSGTRFTFLSNSTGIDPSISWDFDNDGMSDANTAQAAFTFPQAGTYIVKLAVTDCGGTDNAVKVITVIDPTGIPAPNFISNYTIISPGQVVNFYDRSTQAPSSWTWSVTPATFTYMNGTDSSSQNPIIKFNSVASYNITLKAKNAFGEGTSTKTAYIRVVDYCFPGAGLNADIGISRVTFAGIDNVSLIGPATYTNYSQSVAPASVQKGTKYTITLARLTNNEDITRNVWIDYDGDGVFSSTELVASNTPSRSLIWTDTITIPTTVAEGSTRLRIGTSYGLTKNGPCGINPFGEFEDYTVTIFNNLVRPVITMNGSDNITFELGGTYTDLGATANDDVEGNITSRMITTTDLDLTKPGSYTYRYNVSDLDGNSTEAVRYIVITPDVTAPAVTLLGANPMIIPVGLTFTDPGATAFDIVDGNITAKIVVTGGPVITAVPGQYTLTYTSTDTAGNVGTANRVIIVGDTTRPEIVLKGATTITIALGATFVDPGAVVIDNVDFGLSYTVDLSVIDNQKVGPYILTYHAQDATGNQANPEYRTVIVEDMTAPSLTLIGNTLAIEVKSAFIDPGFITTDNYYDDEDITVNITGTVDPNVVGVYFLIYEAVDPSGNKSVLKTREVRVIDSQRPRILLNGDPFVTICQWEDFTDPGSVVIDNYDTGLVAITIGNVESWNIGIYALSYIAEDKSRNEAVQVERIVRVISCITGTKTVSGNASAFTVYPNPSQGKFTVSLDNGTSETFNVEVKDMMGRTVNTEVSVDPLTGSATIQMDNAASGVYFVTVTSGNQVSTKKVEIIK